jgi:6-phosphogluconate dehydrogenase
MRIGVIGLGAMGSRIAERLMKLHYTVVGYDPAPGYFSGARVGSLAELISISEVLWLMVPHAAVDELITEIVRRGYSGTVIDGGNSFYADSIVRAQRCKNAGIFFIDCGVSGGIIAEQGYSLTVGGEYQAYLFCEELFKALAAPHALLYCGPSGSGHFVKMVHNGIEYGLLQAYAEGFDLIAHAPFDLPSEAIARCWNSGALIQSRLLGLFAQALCDEKRLNTLRGAIGESGMGEWAEHTAVERGVTLPALTAARAVRAASRADGSGRSRTTRLIEMVRAFFGGHSVS